MYLSKKTYVKNWEHNPKKDHYEIKVKKDGKIVKDIKPNRISYIEEEVGYWRKANQIHKFFIDLTNDGVDDCSEIYVDTENLDELLEKCKAIKEDNTKAEELLPTSSGFFFGSTEYDEWYFEQIDDTIEILEELFLEKNEKGYLDSELYYRASW